MLFSLPFAVVAPTLKDGTDIPFLLWWGFNILLKLYLSRSRNVECFLTFKHICSFLCMPKVSEAQPCATNQRKAPDKKRILRVCLAVMGISKLASLEQSKFFLHHTVHAKGFLYGKICGVSTVCRSVFPPLKSPEVARVFRKQNCSMSEPRRRRVSSAIPEKADSTEDQGFSWGVLSFVLSLHEQRKYKGF